MVIRVTGNVYKSFWSKTTPLVLPGLRGVTVLPTQLEKRLLVPVANLYLALGTRPVPIVRYKIKDWVQND